MSSAPFCPLPHPPAAPGVPKGQKGGTGHNSTGVVTVHGARYRLRQTLGGPSKEVTAGGKVATDAAKLGRKGVGILCFDTAFLPIDVYLDSKGTAETLYFVGAGLKIDEAIIAQLVLTVFGQPQLAAVVEGSKWVKRAQMVASVMGAFDKLLAFIEALPPPDATNVAVWPQLTTYKPVNDFSQLETYGSFFDGAFNSTPMLGAWSLKFSANKLFWVDPSAETEEFVLHRAVAKALTSAVFPALNVYNAVKGRVDDARRQALAETSWNAEFELSSVIQPAPLPDTAKGLFDTLVSIVGDLIPGAHARELHGRFVRRENVRAVVTEIKTRIEATLDEVLKRIEPQKFLDLMYLRYPFHYKRLYLEVPDHLKPSADLEREGMF